MKALAVSDINDQFLFYITQLPDGGIEIRHTKSDTQFPEVRQIAAFLRDLVQQELPSLHTEDIDTKDGPARALLARMVKPNEDDYLEALMGRLNRFGDGPPGISLGALMIDIPEDV